MTQEISETAPKSNKISVGVSIADIANINTDAIASVIHPDLEIRGSLNKTIFSKGGNELDDFILENIISPHEGDVFTTPGFGTEARNIIFSVIPMWRSDLDIVDKHLLGAARGITETACNTGMKTLAMPLICCGRKGYPVSRGVRLIVQGISERVRPPLKHIQFVCQNEEEVRAYKKRLNMP